MFLTTDSVYLHQEEKLDILHTLIHQTLIEIPMIRGDLQALKISSPINLQFIGHVNIILILILDQS